MQYEREISNKIKKISSEFSIVVLTGARQVGKTTLLKKLFSNYNYVSLDIPSTAKFAEENPDLFLEKYPPPLIIDEVQYAPEIFRNLKVWIDKNRDLKGQLILTGSQKFNLMKEVSDSLAGRVGLIELEPLSIFELSKKEKFSNQNLPEMLERGFYPELWKERTRSSFQYYQSYLNTYLERDVRQIINITSLLDFEKFLRLLATRVGQTLDKSSLSKDVGVKVNTINSWLSVLEASNQIVFLQPYYENFGSRLIKSPKFFFSDVGFCVYLLGLSKASLLDSSVLGSLWENLVFAELRKRNLANMHQGQFWFYRDSLAREVDLLYVNQGKVHFIETKWSARPEEKIGLLLERISSQLKSRSVKKGTLTIISRVQDPYKVTGEALATSIFDYNLPET